MNRALGAFVRAGDVVAEANVRNNRGVLLGFRHDHRRAERDLLRALDAVRPHRPCPPGRPDPCQPRLAGGSPGRCGGGACAGTRRRSTTSTVSVHRAVWRGPRSTELYLSARLIHEAIDVGEGALVELSSSGAELDAAELRVRLAQAHLLACSYGEAATRADGAQAAFVAQHRPAGPPSPATSRFGPGGSRVNDQVISSATPKRWQPSWPAPAGRWPPSMLAFSPGASPSPSTTASEPTVTSSKPERACRRGPVELRSRAWHAEALRRQSHGDDRGPLAARAGLRAVSGQQASVGATELRSHIAGFGEELASLGLSIALRTGTPAQVFAWAERWRAGALRRPTMRRSDDDELAALLDELRAVSLEMRPPPVRVDRPSICSRARASSNGWCSAGLDWRPGATTGSGRSPGGVAGRARGASVRGGRELRRFAPCRRSDRDEGVAPRPRVRGRCPS